MSFATSCKLLQLLQAVESFCNCWQLLQGATTYKGASPKKSEDVNHMGYQYPSQATFEAMELMDQETKEKYWSLAISGQPPRSYLAGVEAVLGTRRNF